MTPVDICNIALSALEQGPITSFDDGTAASIACRSVFHVAARSVLQIHLWDDATEFATLAQDLTGTSPGYAYRFILPADLLFLRRVQDTDQWRKAGRYVLTNAVGPLTIEYTRDLTVLRNDGAPIEGGDPLAVGPLLANAIAYRLASIIGKRLTGSDTVGRDMMGTYRLVMAEAQSVDSSESPPMASNGSTWRDGDGTETSPYGPDTSEFSVTWDG